MPRLSFFAKNNSPFTSLKNANYRRYFIGQFISNVGTWVYTIALALLVLETTGKTQDIGVSMGLQFLPLLFLGAYGGAIADKFPPRKVLLVTNLLSCGIILSLTLATHFEVVNIAWIWGTSFCLGLSYAFDRPAAQAIIYELVGPEDLSNAVSLNSLIMSSARFIGPAVGGLIYDFYGPETCFLINNVSFLVAAGILLLLQPQSMWSRSENKVPSKNPIMDSLRYAWSKPVIRISLIINAIIGCLAFNFVTVITAMVSLVFQAPSSAVGWSHSVSAGGAIAGAIFVAMLRNITAKTTFFSCLVFGCVITAASQAPTLTIFFIIAPLLGFCMTTYLTVLQTTIQKATEPQMLGRVMSLYTMGMFGTTPIGGIIVGGIVDASSARIGLLVGAGSCFFSCVLFLVYRRLIFPKHSPKQKNAN
ncbi:MFS transporter [Aurantivibrio infirmus]